MQVTTDTSKSFDPITLTITIESEQDLCDLWHRFNTPASKLYHDADVKHGVRGSGDKGDGQTYDLFLALDTLLKDRNLIT